MHYFDDAFYVQFPLYNPTAYSSSRGWLLTLLTGDQAIYYAILAFSQYHHGSKSLPTSSSLIEKIQPSEMVNYYVSALKQLQLCLGDARTWSGYEGVLHNVKALACILQFVFLEVFSNSSGNWSFHLKAADALLPSLVQTRIRYSNSGFPAAQDQALQDICCISLNDHLAIELLLSAFLWLNILAQVSTRAKLSSQFNSELLLEKGNINLEHLFGCKNRVSLLIIKISKLDDWKRQYEKNRKLSVAELVRQGAKIESELNQSLSEYSAQKPGQGRTYSSSAREENCLAITKCFSLAALTYLHVVVSGAHPDLPEIDDSVAKGLDVLRVLRDRKLLEMVVWPVCVIGCMASESKQNIFRCLITGEEKADGVVGNFSRTVKIIEHCWKEREAGMGNFDWFCAMKGLGQHVLLL